MPLRQKIGKSFFAILAAIFLVTTDQLSKYIIRISGGFYICNEGIAFGINLPNWAILGLTIATILFISLAILNFNFLNLDFNSNFKFPPYGISLEQKISKFSLILIFSGAFSNLLDRISYGCVIDFIDLKIWPIFNLADIFICAGAFLLILQSANLAKKS